MSQYSNLVGNTVTGVTIDQSRRKFDFGERIAELAPQQSPFFVYLSKVAKKATNDPVFKFLEQRHQWQRRNFQNSASNTSAAMETTGLNVSQAILTNVDVEVMYDKYGNISSTANASVPFLINGQTVAIEVDYAADGSTFNGSATHRAYCKTSAVTLPGADTTVTLTPYKIVTIATGADLAPVNTAKIRALDLAPAQIVGSAWAEGSIAPDGWEDAMFDREGYCQIFKTGMKLFSNTKRATEYRGMKNEYQRVWTEKLMEHKMDLEHAFLFGIGMPDDALTATANTRYTWGILPYTEQNGKIYNFSYSSSGYDAFLDSMEDFFAPESGNSGNKLVLASRKVITYLNKLGSGGFMKNTIGTSQYRLDVANIPGKFGHTVTVVDTIYGKLHFVAEPLLRGMWEDYCVAVDMKNLAYRPLSGNGVNRDTFIETNIQLAEEDGRRDQIITEAGLEISLPETHAVINLEAV